MLLLRYEYLFYGVDFNIELFVTNSEWINKNIESYV